MARHRVYVCIVEAVRTGDLKEPFTIADFRRACPGFGEGTYNAFLHKHAVGNPGGNSDLFERVAPGRFELLQPINNKRMKPVRSFLE